MPGLFTCTSVYRRIDQLGEKHSLDLSDGIAATHVNGERFANLEGEFRATLVNADRDSRKPRDSKTCPWGTALMMQSVIPASASALTFYAGVQVSGGGTRESILTENGKPLASDTREAAEAEVRAYLAERNGPHAKRPSRHGCNRCACVKSESRVTVRPPKTGKNLVVKCVAIGRGVQPWPNETTMP